MPVKVLIPTPLRPYTEQKESVEIEGARVQEILDNLAGRYRDLRKHLFDDAGKLRSFVNVYVNQDDIRSLSRFETEVSESDVVSIVPSIAGGAGASPVEDEVVFSKQEIQRYSRHLIMPEVGMEGQARLKKASVLMIGAGGLGAPMSMYLAAAGVGRLGIVDFDVVDHSNLQRQVTYSVSDVGRPKLEAATDRLRGINPYIEIEGYETRLSSENALDLFRDYDVIADGTDNFPTRYLVNDACVLSGKPNVYGSIFRFEGQVSVFDARRGPCYRCLYPEPPPPGLVPSCAEGGVLGVLPGIVGSLQALEVIKLVLGKGDSLIGRLLVFDALQMKFRELRQRKDPDCPLCGSNPSIRELIDYEEFCGIPAENEKEKTMRSGVPTITVEELKRLFDTNSDVFLLDVREPHEWDIVRIEGATLIPLGRLPHEVHRLDSARDIVVQCRSGARSAAATEFLLGAGFTRVRNLEGGILAWADRIDPTLPKY
jgi:sulfur-carrier protein adenylyltransferase/sulfurtransferase